MATAELAGTPVVDEAVPVDRPPPNSKPQPAKVAPASAAQRPEVPERWIEVVHDVPALLAHRAAWDELALHAIEPNPFYESWMLPQAVEMFGEGHNFRGILVFSKGAKPKDPPLLTGLFPFESRRSYGRLPVSVLGLWKHLYCMLCTPLVRKGHATETLAFLLDWMSKDKLGASLLELPHINGEGPFPQALIEVLNERGGMHTVVDSYSRAFLKPAADAETYFASAMTCHNRQELRRQKRRLSEQGPLEARVLESSADLEQWIEWFLDIEARGWKGQEQTALKFDRSQGEYFRSIAREGFARKQLFLLGIFLGGRPIAMKCNFLAGGGSFAMKIAFDEEFARFSPGVQLEIENILQVHQRPDLKWMDSCAIPKHFMINRLWQDRRIIQKLLISTGGRAGDLTVGLLPFVRAVRRCVRKK